MKNLPKINPSKALKVSLPYPAMLGGAAFPRHLTKPMKSGLRNMQS